MKEACALQMNVIYLHVDMHAMVEVRGQPGVSPCLPSCLDTRVSCLPLSTAEKLACEILVNFPTCCWNMEIMDLQVSSEDLNSGPRLHDSTLPTL